MEIFVLKSDEVAAITRGTHGNPHHILGMHQCLNDCYVNAYLPRATGGIERTRPGPRGRLAGREIRAGWP